MLHEHVQRGIHPIFRLKTKANAVVDAFIASHHTDAMVEIAPTQDSLKTIAERYPGHSAQPIPLCLVKYTIAGTTYVLGTTLFDHQRYRVNALSDVYHARWGIEELYKISKQLMAIEDFHGRTERGVKQELYAHFVLITLARMFSNHSDSEFNTRATPRHGVPTHTNFKNCLITVTRNLESLLLQHATMWRETMNRIVVCIAACRQVIRPNRSYPRRSRKPIGKWKPPKPAKLPTNELPIAY